MLSKILKNCFDWMMNNLVPKIVSLINFIIYNNLIFNTNSESLYHLINFCLDSMTNPPSLPKQMPIPSFLQIFLVLRFLSPFSPHISSFLSFPLLFLAIFKFPTSC